MQKGHLLIRPIHFFLFAQPYNEDEETFELTKGLVIVEVETKSVTYGVYIPEQPICFYFGQKKIKVCLMSPEISEFNAACSILFHFLFYQPSDICPVIF